MRSFRVHRAGSAAQGGHPCPAPPLRAARIRLQRPDAPAGRRLPGSPCRLRHRQAGPASGPRLRRGVPRSQPAHHQRLRGQPAGDPRRRLRRAQRHRGQPRRTVGDLPQDACTADRHRDHRRPGRSTCSTRGAVRGPGRPGAGALQGRRRVCRPAARPGEARPLLQQRQPLPRHRRGGSSSPPRVPARPDRCANVSRCGASSSTCPVRLANLDTGSGRPQRKTSCPRWRSLGARSRASSIPSQTCCAARAASCRTTMPFIRFDDEGVCNYCRTTSRATSLAPRRSCFDLVEPYRRAEGNECIVPFSGGRD